MKTINNSVLSIDIGNSRTCAAIVDLDTITCIKKVFFLNSDFENSLPREMDSLLESIQGGVSHVNISSCIANLFQKTKDQCAKRGISQVNLLRAHNSLPIAFFYDDTSSLGTDRIADALACHYLYKGHNCLIIDSGTAITIDLLHNKDGFLGGSILPGITMQLSSLNSGTDKLPKTDLPLKDCSLPATSTLSCIKSGVLYGTAGAINMHIRHLSNLFENLLVVGTGGAWQLTEHLLEFQYTCNPDLTLLGTALYIP